MAKKSKKGKKKAAKKLSPEEEKQQMFEVLMTKCNMSKDDIEKLYDEFNAENPDGFISMDKYVSSMKVETSVCPFKYKATLLEHNDGRVSVSCI